MKCFILVLVLFSGCATTTKKIQEPKKVVLNSKEKAYVAKISAANPNFNVEKMKSDEAWSRGNFFLAAYSGMKAKTVNDSHMTTYHSKNAKPLKYNIVKSVKDGKIKISVKCESQGKKSKRLEEICRTNEKIMAHYMKTGELNQKFVGSSVTAENFTEEE